MTEPPNVVPNRIIEIVNSRLILLVTSLRNNQPLRLIDTLPLLIAGAAERGVWNAFRNYRGAGGEALNVAASIGGGTGFANAFGPGHGFTAHLLPTTPMIAGAVYKLTGVESGLSEIILATWSIGLVLSSYHLFAKTFNLLGIPKHIILVTLLFVCLAPTYIAQESVDFRVWEGGLTVFVEALIMRTVAAGEVISVLGRSQQIGVSLLTSLLFFINPVVGLTAGLIIAIYLRRHTTIRRIAFLFALSLSALIPLVATWTWRNEAVLHSPVLLRSNAGLELAIAEYDGALSTGPGDIKFMNRLKSVHPLQSRSAFEAMKKAGGEVQYSRMLGRQARAWIMTHRTDTLQLLLMHSRQVVLPSPWIFRIWGSPIAGLQAILAIAAGSIGILGLGAGMRLNARLWIYPLVAVAIPTFLLSPFQPVARYTYLVYSLLCFSGGGLFVQRRF